MNLKQDLDILVYKTRSHLENIENTVGVQKIDANQKWRNQCSTTLSINPNL
jgi:hypothetical protein